ncbi:MAG: hypothetical protein IJY56_00880 [Clostridia bacterium]|nr:hypothetical protein [Clostridia bacterium]
MKRILSVFLAIFLCLSLIVFSACNADQTSSDAGNADNSIDASEEAQGGDGNDSTDTSADDSSDDSVTQSQDSTSTTASNSGVSSTNNNTTTTSKPTSSTVVTKTGSHIVKTKYTTDDIVVADHIVTEYGADNTGAKDATSAIRSAISAASSAGGGTVWMPAGKYRISSNITIPTGVTLRGDYQDPDSGTAYGTIIMAYVSTSTAVNTGLFNIQPSAGVVGLTVYYPNQSISSVKSYPFTFFVNGMLCTIKNCTVINGYRGVGSVNSTAHEMMSVKNLKGTFLKSGVEIHNSADVGTVDGLVVSSKYWANAGSGLTKATASAIETYTKANASGMVITDAEQQQYYNIEISGCKNGIEFPCVTTRYMGAGSFYKLKISNCVYGIYVASGTYGSGLTTIDYRWGYNIANSSIAGSSYSIYNATSKNGTFKLSGVTLSGKTHGNIIENSMNTNLSSYTVDTTLSTKNSGSKFEKVAKNASEATIQAALTRVGNAGGGVVYLPAGKYTITTGLTVPKNVELRGSSSVAQRVGSYGTVLVNKQATQSSASAAESATALVTLNGDNAGISGIFFSYGDNISKLHSSKSYNYYAYAVRGKGTGVYANNICIAGASHGIDFRSCPKHVIQYFVGCCMVNAMNVSGGNGTIMNCLQNATVLSRCGYMAMPESENNGKISIFTQVFDPVTRITTEFIRVSGSNEKILNCFSYGVKTLVKSSNAANLLCVNIGADNIGGSGTGVMHVFSGGSAVVINSLRYNGSSYTNSGCTLKIYNRMYINGAGEKDV